MEKGMKLRIAWSCFLFGLVQAQLGVMDHWLGASGFSLVLGITDKDEG